MKAKKLTTYVVMVSRTFPNYHPRKGQETHFPHLIQQAVDNHGREKIHTIRGNYDLWKKRIDKVNEGKAVLSIRYWSGSPYNSKNDDSKQVEFLQLTKAGIQEVQIDFNMEWFKLTEEVGYKTLHSWFPMLAMNDGLTLSDFQSWFKAQKNPYFHGCIIHFTDFRY